MNKIFLYFLLILIIGCSFHKKDKKDFLYAKCIEKVCGPITSLRGGGYTYDCEIGADNICDVFDVYFGDGQGILKLDDYLEYKHHK